MFTSDNHVAFIFVVPVLCFHSPSTSCRLPLLSPLFLPLSLFSLSLSLFLSLSLSLLLKVALLLFCASALTPSLSFLLFYPICTFPLSSLYMFLCLPVFLGLIYSPYTISHPLSLSLLSYYFCSLLRSLAPPSLSVFPPLSVSLSLFHLLSLPYFDDSGCVFLPISLLLNPLCPPPPLHPPNLYISLVSTTLR